MKRYIIRQGNNSYTLTIPIEWVRQNEFDGGDEIDVQIEENRLVISVPKDRKGREAATSFDVEDFNERTIRNVLNQSYRKGFDRIRITYSSPQQLKDIKSITKDTLLGFDVTDEVSGHCTIQNIAEPSSERYDIILRKIFLIIKQEGEEITQSLESGRFDMEKRADMKNQVDNYTNFIRRVVIKDKIGGLRNSYLLFYAVSMLSLIHHAYYYLHYYLHAAVGRRNLSKEVILVLHKANKMFDTFYTAFYKKDIEAAHGIGVQKDEIIKKDIYPLIQKKSGADNIALYHIGEIVRHTHLSSTVLFGMITEKEA